MRLKTTDLAYSLTQSARVMHWVLEEGKSLDRALIDLAPWPSAQVQGAVQDLAYFGVRWYGRSAALARAISKRDTLNPVGAYYLLCLSLALLWETQSPKYPAHTVVDQAVQACAAHREWGKLKGLLNACLRNFLRDRAKWATSIAELEMAQTGFPVWWSKKLRKQHPDQVENLLAQANTHPPMALRVNARVGNADAYAQLLKQQGLGAHVTGPQSVVLNKPVSVRDLPGFDKGHVSVQDLAAQMAAPLLNLKDGQRVLDACAAPGGKTGHILELANVDLLALDSSAERLMRVKSNLDRIKPTLPEELTAQVVAANAEDLESWWDGNPFDAILLDLPCSGSGVVRRHPDIRWLRRESDIPQLSRIQHKILDTLWSTLKVNGTLLLVTCSVFSEEGPNLAEAFLKSHPDALAVEAPGVVMPKPDFSSDSPYLLSPDGFFYAKFTKTHNNN